ncbi:hypothetical protein ABPG77_004272 [Micractinium sp. CCAP 211/92]
MADPAVRDAERWLLGADAAENGTQGAPTSAGLPTCYSNLDNRDANAAPALLAEQLLDARWNGSACCAPSNTSLRHQRSLAAGLGTAAEKLVGDAYKEARRRDLRTVFNHLRWKQHRSSLRYWRHLLGSWGGRGVADVEGEAVAAFDLPSKVRGLSGPLLYVLFISTLVAVYHTLAEAGKVPHPKSDWAHLGNNAPFQLSSFALSLLLVFRTNASYSRFLDARKAWGSVTNRTRDLARQGLAYAPSGQQELPAMLCRWLVAFAYSMMCSLREDEDEAAELAGVLPRPELDALLAATHRPNYCLQVLSSLVAEAAAAAAEQQASLHRGLALQLQMDANLTALEDALGTCERILRTPIPLAYTRHTSRFMMIWLSLLPLTLWESCGWAMLPFALIIAFLLLGIEEIGVSIEEPFSILPLCHICGTIQRNVAELLATTAGSNHDLCGQPQGGAVAVPPASLVAAALRGEASSSPAQPWEPTGA